MDAKRSALPLLVASLLACTLCDVSFGAMSRRIDLSGEWSLRLDPEGVGEEEAWWSQPLPDRLTLPGSIQAQGFGEEPSLDGPWTGGIGVHVWKRSPIFEAYRQPDNLKCPIFLTPPKLYVGAAWFQREITIPASWTGQTVELFLERPHWKTTVWIDGNRIGRRRLLSSPHCFDLGMLDPGTYTLTVRVSNTLDPNVGENANSVGDHTQSNWNGIAGRMELIARPPVCVRDMRLSPNVADKTVTVQLRMSTPSGQGAVEMAAAGANGNPERPPAKTFDVIWTNGLCEVVYPLGASALTWNEFHPYLYEITASLNGHSRTETFGLREWGIRDKMFTVNDKIFQLRGTLDKAIFPLTGYPATDVAYWRKVMRACKEFGLNHVRYHSWCPPGAAFTAADEVGMYLLPECSLWSFTIGQDTNLQSWVLQEEMPGILDAYADHPSFFAIGAGNEGANTGPFSIPFLEAVKAREDRILVTDFAVTGNKSDMDFAAHAIRGLGMQCSTMPIYDERLPGFKIPMIAHETTQIAVMPDRSELPRYTGAMKPDNLEVYLDIFRKNGLGPFEREVFLSMGHFQTLFYKGDIESYLRTPNYAGYQLLGLNDFTGQGTALVGALNVFWEPKAYTSATEYRRFQGPLIPLARMARRVYTRGETFEAGIQVAHYAEDDLAGATVTWSLETQDGQTVAEGRRENMRIAQGGVRDIGTFTAALAGVEPPAQLTFRITVAGAGVANDYHIWVYDEVTADPAPKGLLVTQVLDDEAVAALRAGGAVCLFTDPNRLAGAEGAFGFQPVFWNRITFPQQQNSGVGLLIDDNHPALARFPTEFYADWQWEELMNGCRPVNVSAMLPETSRAIVQFNDCWTRSRKLAVLLEAKVASGRLLFSSFDLNNIEGRPVAAQLRCGVLAYVASDAFRPRDELTVEQVRELTKIGHHSVLRQINAKVHSASSEEAPDHTMDRCIDSNPYTYWQSQLNPETARVPHWVVIEMPTIVPMDGVSLLPRNDSDLGNVNHYEIYVSETPDNWGEPVAKGRFPWGVSGKRDITFEKRVFGRYLKFVATHTHKDCAAIAELDLLLDLDEAISQGVVDPSGFMIE